MQLISDGGGRVSAALRPIVGADPVIRFLFGLARKYEGTDVVLVDLNGEPGLVMTADGEPIATVQLAMSGGRIDRIWSMRNPNKLAAVDTAREVTTR